MRCPMRKLNPFEEFVCPFGGVRSVIGDECRYKDIFKHGILWKQMMLLKYESDDSVSISRQFRLRERKWIGVVNLDLSDRRFL